MLIHSRICSRKLNIIFVSRGIVTLPDKVSGRIERNLGEIEVIKTPIEYHHIFGKHGRVKILNKQWQASSKLKSRDNCVWVFQLNSLPGYSTVILIQIFHKLYTSSKQSVSSRKIVMASILIWLRIIMLVNGVKNVLLNWRKQIWVIRIQKVSLFLLIWKLFCMFRTPMILHFFTRPNWEFSISQYMLRQMVGVRI